MYCQAASQYFVDTVCLVCLSVRSSLCLSVSQTVTILSPAKTAEPIEMPFGMRTPVGQKHCIRRRPVATGVGPVG